MYRSVKEMSEKLWKCGLPEKTAAAAARFFAANASILLLHIHAVWIPSLSLVFREHLAFFRHSAFTHFHTFQSFQIKNITHTWTFGSDENGGNFWLFFWVEIFKSQTVTSGDLIIARTPKTKGVRRTSIVTVFLTPGHKAIGQGSVSLE